MGMFTPKERKSIIFSSTAKERGLKFRLEYAKELSKIENNILKFRTSAATAKDYKKQLLYLNKCIEHLEQLKKICHSKGLNGYIYFEQTWEHLHNSQNPDFSYQDAVNKEIQNILELHDVLLPKIRKFISKNGEILQTDLYKEFSTYSKEQIMECLKILIDNEGLKKEKSGRTNRLFF